MRLIFRSVLPPKRGLNKQDVLVIKRVPVV